VSTARRASVEGSFSVAPAGSGAGTAAGAGLVEDPEVGQNVFYGSKQATVLALGYGELKDGTRIRLANIRFPNGLSQTVFVTQLRSDG
jgi:hypothetical protein